VATTTASATSNADVGPVGTRVDALWSGR